MLINNLEEMINGNILSKDNYYICDFKTNLTLIKNGFSPISRKKNKFYFAKTEKLLSFLKDLER